MTPPKRQKTCDIRQLLCVDDILKSNENIKKAFQSAQSMELENCNVICGKHSFPAIHLLNVFDSDFLETVRGDVINMPFKQKNNDLYSFRQAPDLKAVDIDSLNQLRSVLSSEWFIGDILTAITGIPLFTDHCPDIAAQIYQNGDYLLCHDDDIVKNDFVRRIAFIIYLVDKDWDPAVDGGRLELFSTDNDGYPDKVAASIAPKWNSIALFEVTPTSFHQVSEVLSVTKERISITGWFYGDHKHFPDSPSLRDVIPLISSTCSPESAEGELEYWLHDDYLRTSNLDKIARKFIEESAISLRDFVRTDRLETILSELDSNSIKYEEVGPANYARYSKLLIGHDNSVVRRFSNFLQSKTFNDWLNTTLKVSCTSCLNSGWQRHSAASYSLMSDDVKEPMGLDLIFQLSNSGWDSTAGGEVLYISDEETLLEVPVRSNELSLILRNDPDILRFSKYINNHANSRYLYRFSCTYEVVE